MKLFIKNHKKKSYKIALNRNSNKLTYFIYLRCLWFKKFKNYFIRQGKKQKIEKKFKWFILRIKLKYITLNPIIFFYNALIIHRIAFNFYPKKYGKKILILPKCLLPLKQYNIALFTLIKIIKQCSEYDLLDKLDFEFSSLIFEQNKLLQQKQQFYILAVENRTHLHYRWHNKNRNKNLNKKTSKKNINFY